MLPAPETAPAGTKNRAMASIMTRERPRHEEERREEREGKKRSTRRERKRERNIYISRRNYARTRHVRDEAEEKASRTRKQASEKE